MERYTPGEAFVEAEALRSKIHSGEAADFKQAQAILATEAENGSIFRAEFDRIMNKELSPENIDTYTEKAVQELVELVDAVLAKYREIAQTDGFAKNTVEDAALRLYGLSNINEILSYISEKEKEIKRLDSVVLEAVNSGSVIVPPQKLGAEVTVGSGSFDEKKIIPRTKTILFILNNDFDIDIQNQEELVLKTGVLADNMMRKLSYVMIEVPKLKRTILACDEEGNVTYVFDCSDLLKLGISDDSLINLNKEELNALTESQPGLGKRVIYSNRFVTNIVAALNAIKPSENRDVAESETAQYLYPKAPEGYRSANGMAVLLGLSGQTIFSVAQKLKDTLGEVKRFRFHQKTTFGYSPEQQEMIRQYLSEQGYFIEKAPEDVLSIVGIADKLGVAPPTVSDAVYELGERLGEVTKYRFRGVVAPGFTLQQQEMIEQRLAEKGAFIEKAPGGVLSAVGITKKLGVASGVVPLAIERLGDLLGETKEYKFNNKLTVGYSPEQQEKIQQYLAKRGLFGEEPPEGVLSVAGLSKKLGVGSSTIFKAIEGLGEELGEVKTYRFYSRNVPGYTPEQLEAIKEYLKQKGVIIKKAPEGVLTVGGIAKKLGVNISTVSGTIEKLGEELGEVNTYKFHTVSALGYTPEQQEMIIEQMKKRGVFSEKAPSGVLTVAGMSKKFGVYDNRTVKKAIMNIGDSLGEPEVYIFGYTPQEGYSLEQQEMIQAYLTEKGIIKS